MSTYETRVVTPATTVKMIGRFGVVCFARLHLYPKFICFFPSLDLYAIYGVCCARVDVLRQFD